VAEPERLLDELAGAILDGTPVDWTSAESNAGEFDRALLAPLKALATIGSLHRGSRVQRLHTMALAPGDPVRAPERWGPLRVFERIGGGAFGEVYRAWDTVLDREVALKLLRPGRGSAAARADAIIHEGRLLARVRHPNVVTIYGAELIGDRIGLWMELVRGRTLEQALEQGRTFTAGEAIDIGIELCRAVSAVHEAGLLHRDIKPHNVMLADDRRVVLMDFGAGRRLDDAAATDLAGTPLYLAPEVLQGQEARARSDVYSLGVLLYHILTRAYPVQARSVAELKRAHTDRTSGQGGAGLAPHPQVPARLAAVLARATDPRPERRPPSAAALAGELQAARRDPRAYVRHAAAAVAALVAMAMAAFLVVGAIGVIRPSGSSGDVAVAPVVPAPGSVRLAVLPFLLAGDDADASTLRDGMARDLIVRLESYHNAHVVSTESVFSASALNLPLAGIGARLGVSSILTGRLDQSNGTVLVEATLLRLPDERPLWTRRYAGPVADVLDIHRGLAADVADTLGLHRQGGSQDRPARDVNAYTQYVRGLTALDRFTPEGTRLALQLFDQTLALDPDYAQAHAAVALVYLQVNPTIPNVSGAEALRRATQAAAQALSLDEWLPEVHVAAALVKSAHADWTGAERDYRRAIELGPSNVLARQQYAHWLSLHGRHDEAIAQARIAESLDPLSPRATLAVASALRFARRYEEAIPQALRALELDPAFLSAYLNLGHNYQGLGRLDEAIDAFERMGRQSGNLGHAYAQAGRTAEARALIAWFEQRYAETGLGAGDIAQIHSGLADVDRAFEWLERWDVAHVGWPTTFKVAPVWDALRADPRFELLLEKHGLAD
jgi:eukaryotic-like serine/threonine-protein kinase